MGVYVFISNFNIYVICEGMVFEHIDYTDMDAHTTDAVLCIISLFSSRFFQVSCKLLCSLLTPRTQHVLHIVYRENVQVTVEGTSMSFNSFAD